MNLLIKFQLYDLPAALQAVVGLAPPPTVSRLHTMRPKIQNKPTPTLPPLPSVHGWFHYLIKYTQTFNNFINIL